MRANPVPKRVRYALILLGMTAVPMSHASSLDPATRNVTDPPRVQPGQPSSRIPWAFPSIEVPGDPSRMRFAPPKVHGDLSLRPVPWAIDRSQFSNSINGYGFSIPPEPEFPLQIVPSPAPSPEEAFGDRLRVTVTDTICQTRQKC
jgi:hypothetical protein